jgi:tetratricopeptide (TPR) repeat protein
MGKAIMALQLVVILSVGLASGQDQASLVKKHFEQGVAYLRADRPRDAERELRRVIELDPADAQAYNLLGSIYDSLGQRAEAESSFRKAIELAPSFPAPYNNLAISYLRQKRTDEAIKTFQKLLKLDPQNVTGHYNLGLLYRQVGDLTLSLRHLERARALRPNDPAIAYNLASTYVQAGALNSALPILQALERQPEASQLPEVQNLLGTTLVRLGRLDPALAHLQKAVKLDPTGPDNHYKLALAWQKKGNLNGALREIQETIALQQPPVAESYLVLGMIQRERGETEKAEQAFKEAFKIAPDGAATRFALAVLLRDAGHYQEALRQFQQVKTLRPSANVDYQLASTYYLVGNFAKALQLLEQIPGAGKATPPARYYKLLAETNAKMERWPATFAALEKALDLDPHDPSLYVDLGFALADLNALQEAEQLFLGVLKHIPDSPEIYVGLARVRMLQDHNSEALEAFRRALELNPDSAQAYYLMGNCLNGMERFKEAQEAYRKAILLNPERDDFHFSLGSLLENQGDTGAALSEFEKAASLNPASADAHYRLGRLYAQKGNDTLAMEQFRKAIDLRPKDPHSYDQLARVYVRIGKRSEAQKALETFQELKRTATSSNSPSTESVKLKPVEYYLRFLSRENGD